MFDFQLILLEISANFHNDWRWHDSLCHSLPQPWSFFISALPVTKNKVTSTVSYNRRALVVFFHDAPNSSML